MKDRVFKFYSDSGHGWLAVKVMDLFDTCTAHKISNYSYIRGLTAYLEEDSDAGKFIENWKKLHGDFKYEAKYIDGCSPIRSYERYSIQQAEQVFVRQTKTKLNVTLTAAGMQKIFDTLKDE